MKKIFSLFIAIVACTFVACSDDDDNPQVSKEGSNNVSFEFDASFADQQFILGKKYKLNGEELTVSAFDYIVSNFVLITEDGKEYVYPKEKSFFIISEGGKKLNKKTQEYLEVKKITKVELTDIPAGKYTKVRFGIGADEETYKGGIQFANKLWERAEEYSLVWTWATGYKFLVLEGNYAKGEKAFKYHVASSVRKGDYAKDKDVYKEVTLDLTNQPFLVDKDKSPQLHLIVDAAKMLKGKNIIKVSETPTLMGPQTKPISENSLNMFAFDHVHYGSQKH